MSKQLLALAYLLVGCYFISFSQTKPHRCAGDEKMEAIYAQNPDYKKEITKSIQNFAIAKTPNAQKATLPPIITIPCHVVIVHPPGQSVGTGINFSMAHIQSQIDVLTDDFRRWNVDAGNTPAVFSVQDSEIQFCLATTDPSGNPTDGVTRHASNQNFNNNEFALKSATGWPRADYLNIYVGQNTGALGWAYLPSTTNLPNPTLDGIVIESGTFGGPGFGTINNFDLGRTAVHEVGHYLGLPHVWGGGCGSDDGFADTPNQSGPNSGCPNHPSPSCGNSGDMFMNYMDYVYDDCYNAFSTDQTNYMRQILMTSRSSLLTSAATNCSLVGPALSASIIALTDVDCFGGSSGSLTVEATGGTSPYTYSINGGTPQTSNVFSNLSAGFYTITVLDTDGNTFPVSDVISEPSPIIITQQSIQHVDCFANTNGSITVDAAGGTPPVGNLYMYSIDGGPFSPVGTFGGLAAGNYQIEVMDGNNCTETTFINISEPSELELSMDASIAADCFGNATGSVEVSALGGTPAYSYSMDQSNYQPMGNFNSLAAGNYTVYVADANNCTEEINVEVLEPEVLILVAIGQTDVDCFGNGNGIVNLEGIGGSPGYEYAIDGGAFQSSPDFDNLFAGTYTFSILDANGCETTTSATVSEPQELTLDLINTVDVDCAGDNSGEINVFATGGNQGYTYILNGTTNSTGQFANLTAGSYSVEVVDANGCNEFLTAEIIENSTLDLQVLSADNVSCFNGNDGNILAQGLGGNGTYQYSLNGGTFANNANFQNLIAGNYALQVLDGNGCIETINYEITEPTEVSGALNNLQNPACFGNSDGLIEVQGSGGDGNFTYILNGISNSTGQFESLAEGTYTVEISDGSGCLGTTTAIIEAPQELIGNLHLSNNVDCFGNDNGSISILGNGGTGNYAYELNGETNTTGIFENLSAGDYLAKITDANGCITNVPANISEPTELIATLDGFSNPDCFQGTNGNLTVTANGGAGDYQYILDGVTTNDGHFDNLTAGLYVVTTIDGNGCVTNTPAQIQDGAEIFVTTNTQINVDCFGNDNGSVELMATGGNGNFEYSLNGNANNSGNFDNLNAGVYPIQITDLLGCIENYEVEITEPTELTTQISNMINIDCHGNNSGEISISANGGTGNIEYSLNDVTNSNGVFNELTAGEYQIIATDDNDCEIITDVEITEPSPISSEIIATQNVTCFNDIDGNFEVLATGGNGNFQYNLNGEMNATGYFENLENGEYNVQIIDANNCESAIYVIIETPEELTIDIENLQSIACSSEDSGLIEVSATGGNGDYQYTLNNETNETGIFENLPAGNYEIQVADANNCQNSVMATIEQTTELGSQIINLSNINCAGDNDGIIEVEAIGGSGNYTFTLNDETNQTGIFEDLPVGTYEVFIEDDADCNTMLEFEITEPLQLNSTSIQVAEIECFGDETGMVQAMAEGGTPGYEFTLGFVTNNTGLFENLNGGWHNVFITDLNGCGTNTSIFVEEPEAISGSFDNENISCFGETDGQIEVLATGGVGDFSYTLGNETNQTGLFENLAPDEYQITISDANNCELMISSEIIEPTELIANDLVLADLDCFENESGMVQASATGGTSPYNYTLNGETNDTGLFEGLPAGMQTVEIEDENGCLVSQDFELDQPSELLINVITIQNETGSSDGFFDVEVSGGMPPYMFSLDGINFSPIPPFTNLSQGIYTAFVEDANGCLVEIEVEVGLDVATSEPDAGLNYLEVFPNPFSNDLWVELELETAQELNFQLFTITGIQVFNASKPISAGKQIFKLDFEKSIPNGAYLLEVRGAEFGKWFRVLRE